MDSNFHPIYHSDSIARINPDKGIIIGDHCWVGSRCNILKGVQIGNDCIIAFGSTVTKSFSKNGLIIGNDKILKEKVMWKYNEDSC